MWSIILACFNMCHSKLLTTFSSRLLFILSLSFFSRSLTSCSLASYAMLVISSHQDIMPLSFVSHSHVLSCELVASQDAIRGDRAGTWQSCIASSCNSSAYPFRLQALKVAIWARIARSSTKSSWRIRAQWLLLDGSDRIAAQKKPVPQPSSR